MWSWCPRSPLIPLCAPHPQNLLSRQLLLTSSHQAGREMLTLGGPLEPRALRVQGLDPRTLWGWWNPARVPIPPLRRRPLAPLESLGWTVRRKATMMMRECPKAWDWRAEWPETGPSLLLPLSFPTASSPSCLPRSSCLCHPASAGPSHSALCPRSGTHPLRRMDGAPIRCLASSCPLLPIVASQMCLSIPNCLTLDCVCCSERRTTSGGP